jgi:hypothetical protein
MRRSLLALCVLVALLGWSCATLQLLRGRRGPVVAPATPPDGYVIRELQVRFVFDPARYDSLADDSSGARVALAGTRIESVHVAGDFNHWSRSAWRMTPEYRGPRARYTLEHRLAEIGTAREYAFRFVVNGRWSVMPGPRTPNRRPERSGLGGYDLVLTLD